MLDFQLIEVVEVVDERSNLVASYRPIVASIGFVVNIVLHHLLMLQGILSLLFPILLLHPLLLMYYL